MDGMVGGFGGAGVWDVFFLACTTKSETKYKKEEKTSTQKTDRLEHQQEGSGTKDTVGLFGEGSSHARQQIKECSWGGEGDAMIDGRCIRTHAGVPQQCLGWMNRRGAAPGAMREREKERRGQGRKKRRGLTEPKPGRARGERRGGGGGGGQRHTETEAKGEARTSPSVCREDTCVTGLCVTVAECSQGA